MNFLQQLLLVLFSVSGQELVVHYIPPPTYAGISSVYYNSTSTFYFLSGLESTSDYLQGIQQIYKDPQSGVWRYRSPANTVAPLPRSYYGSFLYKDRYYIYGGIGIDIVMKDFWFYDIPGDYWQRIQAPNPITRRYSFAYTSFEFIGKTYFAVAGGKYNSYYDNLLDFYL